MELFIFILFLLFLFYRAFQQQSRRTRPEDSPRPQPRGGWPDEDFPFPPLLVPVEPAVEVAAEPAPAAQEEARPQVEVPLTPPEPPAAAPAPGRVPEGLVLRPENLWPAVIWSEIIGPPVSRRRPPS